MIILGIETSCDETAVAVVEHNPKKGDFFIHSNIISSQVKIHSKYGGIVPEIAARNHVVNIIPVVDEALSHRAISCKAINHKYSTLNDEVDRKKPTAYDLKLKACAIDAIAVTNGPGLITSLLVGVETAKVLAYVWNKPLIAVNHLEGHICSAMSQKNKKTKKQKNTFDFPALALIVSGGHTQLILMTDYGKYKIIGETRDDAAGEAFDKVGKLLGLGYPGGPAISAYAKKFQNPNNKLQTNSKFKTIKLPRPMINSKDFDFSFSGLKTAVLYSLKAISHKAVRCKVTERMPITYNLQLTAEMCAEFQQAVIDVLATKTLKATKKYDAKTIILCGGVSANKELRKRFEKEFGDKLLLPGPGLSTDNAVMIAMAGVRHFRERNFIELNKIKVDPNLTL